VRADAGIGAAGAATGDGAYPAGAPAGANDCACAGGTGAKLVVGAAPGVKDAAAGTGVNDVVGWPGTYEPAGAYVPGVWAALSRAAATDAAVLCEGIGEKLTAPGGGPAGAPGA